LLGIIAISVYVATQKGDFNVTRFIIIDIPRPVIFNYINDYKNWEDWDSRKEDDPGLKFVYPENTVGKGAFYNWSGNDGDGKTITVFVKENDSIAQKVIYSGKELQAYISFKDTLGKTKVTWSSKGNVDFMAKVYATFTGGVNRMIANRYERSLNNLNKVIIREINTFDVKVNGIVQKPGTFYIKQTTTCTTSDVQNRLLVMLPKIITFFKSNKMTMNGSPFVIYQNIDNVNNTVTFSVCGPLKEEIFVSPESDISTGWLEPFTALKTTLTGDYSHKDAAWKKASEYLSKNNIEANIGVPKMDIYIKSASDIKYPSKWVTEILIPVKTFAPKPLATVTPATETPKPPVTTEP
jgi:effector-binding domain-containing protein